MEADDVRRLMAYLRDRVRLARGTEIEFEVPGAGEMAAAGLHLGAVKQLLEAPWLAEMIDDVRETPGFCEPDTTPDQVLQYAQDVVDEYIRKRFQP